MALCAICGVTTISGEELCSYHPSAAAPEGWAAGNRVLCDFIHRGVEPRRLAAEDRDDDIWSATPASGEPRRTAPDARRTRPRNTAARSRSRSTPV